MVTPLPVGIILGIAILIVLIGFLAGYSVGKKQGRFLGSRETQTEFPLILRQKSLEEGRCLICSQSLVLCCQITSHIFEE